MKVYFDNCVLNRPFDDQTAERIYLETRAFLLLLKMIENGVIELINSFAIHYEIDKISEWEKKEKIHTFLSLAKDYIPFDQKMNKRASKLMKVGFRSMDALHISAAEYAKVDCFVTCDDQILKVANKNKKYIDIRIISVLQLFEEIYHDNN